MPEERYKEETKETKEAKETNKSCRKEGRYRRERSVKEKMKKSIAAVMGIAVSAALLLGGCASNTTDETKTGSSADTSDVTSASDLDSLQTSDPPKEQTAGAQDSDAQDTEAQDSEASAGQAEFTPGTYIGDGESMVYSHFLLHRRELPGQPRLKKTQRYIPGMMTIRSGFCRMVRSLPSR